MGSGLQGLQSLPARTKLNPGSKLGLWAARLAELASQAPIFLEIRSLARTKLNPCSKLGLWAARLAELASQNKTESRLQAWALGCKACRARQPGSKLRLWAASSKLRGSGLEPRSLQVVKSPKTYKSPRERAVSERLYAAILSFLGLLLLRGGQLKSSFIPKGALLYLAMHSAPVTSQVPQPTCFWNQVSWGN